MGVCLDQPRNQVRDQLDQERYVAEPNQVLHPGRGRTERYNDANGAAYETTHWDAHGNAFTQNHQLGPAERYGYNYAGAGTPSGHHAPAQSWAQPTAGVAAAAGAAGAVGAVHNMASEFVHRDQDDSGEGDGAGAVIVLVVAVAVALGPLILGVWMFRRARARGTTTAHATLVLLMEGAWLATLWAWLFDGGTSEEFMAWGIAFTAVVWYALTMRAEARLRREEAEDRA